jgi:alkanesulfonate monooxygenase SsuD/methylene tetrahydromethanopterin reductase-like flavin-dependent oxidoreductase (luciferase family)
VDGRFLQANDTAGLRAEASRAEAEGAAAVFVRAGELGDPIVLAAGLASDLPRLLLGVRIELDRRERHPAMLARDITSLDLICGGRSVLCFAPPFADSLEEAITVCRALWRSGEAVTDGPAYPVRAAANRSRPLGESGPLIALDLTRGEAVSRSLAGAADLLLRPAEASAACVLERV